MTEKDVVLTTRVAVHSDELALRVSLSDIVLVLNSIQRFSSATGGEGGDTERTTGRGDGRVMEGRRVGGIGSTGNKGEEEESLYNQDDPHPLDLDDFTSEFLHPDTDPHPTLGTIPYTLYLAPLPYYPLYLTPLPYYLLYLSYLIP